jgi:hypothetical protein
VHDGMLPTEESLPVREWLEDQWGNCHCD